MKQYTKQYIDGKWVEGSGKKTIQNINPYNNEVLYEFCSAGEKDIDRAFIYAKNAFIEWSNIQPRERQHYLEKLIVEIENMKDDIYACLIEEGGSTRIKADFEYNSIIDVIKYLLCIPYMMEGKILPSNAKGRDNFIVRKPVGVISIITPWNVPILLAMRSVIPAVATGNSVVLKPSTQTPASAFIIAELFEKAGFPAGLINVISGYGSEIGRQIVNHPFSAMISFTGSTYTGKQVGLWAGEKLKPVLLELGGNNVMIVLNDANVQRAAEAAAFGAYFHQGQICMALNRIIVMKDIHKAFLEAFVEETKELKVGSANNYDAFIGPLISKEHKLKVEKHITDTIRAGAKTVLEGKSEDNFMSPWIFDEVTNDMPAAAVCCVLTATDEKHAIELANDTNYGLSASIYTGDRYHGMQLADQIVAGMVHVNDQSIIDESHVMFGGEKESGIGRFNGQWVVNSMTKEKWISIQSSVN